MRRLITLMMIFVGGMVVNATPGNVLPGFKKRVRTHVKKAEHLPFVLPSKYLVAAPPRAEMRVLEAKKRVARTGEMETVERLTSVDISAGSNNYSIKFEYDKYGFPAKQVSTMGSYIDFEYTWRVPGRVWATKRVRNYNSNGELQYTEVDITRTFHSNGTVATNWEVSMQGERIYSEYDEKGNLLKKMRTNGDDNEIHTYTYFPLLDQWLESTENSYSKTLVELDGNNGYVVRKMELYDNVWRVTSEDGYWYDNTGRENGSMNVYYNYYDGEVSLSGYGYRTNTEESGDYVIVSSEQLELEGGTPRWVAGSVTKSSKNYDAPWSYNPGEVRTKEEQRYEDGVWETLWKSTYTWVKAGVVKEEYRERDIIEVSYYAIGDDLQLGDDCFYDEETGRYGTYENDENYSYYTYYEADGRIINKFREKDEYDPYKLVYEEWEVWKDNRWQKCTGTITVYEGSDDKYVITFDSQSRVVMSQSYESGTLDYYAEYVYTDNGYVEKCYRALGYEGKFYLDVEGAFTREGDNVVSVSLEYNSNGDIEYSNKVISNPKERVQYYFTLTDGEWVFSSGYAEAVSETLADGTNVYIERSVPSYGSVVNSRKSVELDLPNHKLSERYDWDEDRKQWSGIWKTERIKPEEFRVIEPVNPMVYEDEYFFPVTDDEVVSFEEWYESNWLWDSEKSEWYINSYPLPEISNPNEYTRIVKSVGEDWENTATTVVDNQHRKIEYCEMEYSHGNVKNLRYTWAYDEKGRLTNTTEQGGGWSSRGVYHYGPVEIVSGVEEIVADATTFTVYNLQGFCVLRSVSLEEVKQLPSGLYIVNGRKVVIR